MRAILTICLVIFSFFGAEAGAHAACDAKCRKVMQLVAALHYERSLADLTNTCMSSLQRLHPDRLINEDPNAFGGVTPASKRWPEIVSAFDSLVQEACGDNRLKTALLDEYRIAWQARLNDKQLNAALAFLNSRDGRAFGEATADVHRVVAREYATRSEEMQQSALVKFNQRVREVISR